MAKPPTFDVVAAHRYFAAQCFNDTWGLMDKPDRTARDDQAMVALSQASIHHWMHREDCDDQKMSIGFWQASRVQSMLNNASEAKRLGEICLSYSQELEPFYLGYAHEALARANRLSGDADAAARHLLAATELLADIAEPNDRDVLAKDLDQLR